METINVNCVYGENDVIHIEKCLIPALRTATRLPIRLRTLNYNPNSSARISASSDRSLIVEDIENACPAVSGFAKNHNLLFDHTGSDDSFVIINPDCIPMEGSIDALLSRKAIGTGRVGIVEARQWPFEHPKYYDPLTYETPWASGAFCLIDSKFYREIGGMDDVYFLYMEDVDLSWQAWLNGYRVLYEPAATTMHFSGGPFYRPDLQSREERYSLRNFLIIAKKFFGDEGEELALKFLLTHPNQADVALAIEEYKRDYASRISKRYIDKRHPQVKIVGTCLFSDLRQ